MASEPLTLWIPGQLSACPRCTDHPACRPGPGVSALHQTDSESLWGARCGLWKALGGPEEPGRSGLPSLRRPERTEPHRPLGGAVDNCAGRIPEPGGAPGRSGGSSPHPARLRGWVMEALPLPLSTFPSATPDPGPLPSKHLEAPSTLNPSWVRGDTGAVPATPQNTWSLAWHSGLWTGMLPGSRPLGLRPRGWN